MCELVNYYVFDAAALVLAQVLTDNKSCNCFVPYRHNQQRALPLGRADSKGLRICITFRNAMNAICCPVRKNICYAGLPSLATDLASMGTSSQSQNTVCTLVHCYTARQNKLPAVFDWMAFYMRRAPSRTNLCAQHMYINLQEMYFYTTCTDVVSKRAR